jgi:fatty acid desaturase
MEEHFETRPLLELAVLRGFQQRDDWHSALRLFLHLSIFVALTVAVMLTASLPLLALPLAVALGFVWAGLFGPFHECVHGTAFKSRRGNVIGSWLSGIPFMIAPAVYRTFHFEHHRHTQDPDKDPEISSNVLLQDWPTGLRNWASLAAGIGIIRFKLIPLLGFSFKPRERWQEFALWADLISDPPGLVRECRILLAVWVVLLLTALVLLPGGGWILLAAWASNAFLSLWVAAEHTGLPLEGSILERTRTVTSHALVRWFQWNMNYHAEHHAWPSIPWYRLPVAHDEVAAQLGSLVPGYIALHRNVIAARNTPSCDPQAREPAATVAASPHDDET